MKGRARVFIYVQHLLGAGHLVRAMALAKSLAHEYSVCLVSGGLPIEREVEGYRFVQLPTIRVFDQSFDRLVGEDDQPVDESYRVARRALLLDTLADFNPQVVITETYPFGRRQFRFEIEPMLEWCREHKTILIASIRDILQRRSLAKEQEMVRVVLENYDLILVHSDDNFVKLQSSFSLTAEISEKIAYTGYIHADSPSQSRDENQCDTVNHPPLGTGEVIVAGGSGSVSGHLLSVAQATRPISVANQIKWRLLTGRTGHQSADSSSHSASDSTAMVIEPNRSDYPELLRHCRLSVSQAGYNSVLDLLAAGCPAIVVPFEGDGETEQLDRARALAEAGRLVMIREAELTPNTLAAAIDQVWHSSFNPMRVKMDGDKVSTLLVTELINRVTIMKTVD
jgi:predicted glycosyltransferase